MVRPRIPYHRCLSIVWLTIALAGCGGGTTGESAISDGPLWARVDSLDTGAFLAAWDNLGDGPFRRTMRLEQFDESDRRTAFREFVVRSGTGTSSPEISRIDSAGTFQFGIFAGVVSETAASPSSVDLASYVLPDEAPYLSPRNRDKYVIEELADSTLRGVPIRRLEIRARPGEGDDEAIRRVRYSTIAATGEVVAVLLERIDVALLFTDQSRIYVERRTDGTGGMIPFLSRYETWIRARVGSDRRFRMTTAWYGD